MTSTLLWDLEETARQLGNVSTRHVQRMIASGVFKTKKVGRRIMVKADSVVQWVDEDDQYNHTEHRVERGVLGEKVCQHASKTKMGSTNVRTRGTTGPVTSTQAARELADLLSPKAKQRQRRS